MSDDLRDQIYHSLNLRDTEDLVEIWRANDRVEWSDIAFDAVRQILQVRLGELPPQGEPVLEQTEYDEEFDELNLRKEDTPVFYKTGDVLWLNKWLYRAAIALMVTSVISGLVELPVLKGSLTFYFLNGDTGSVWNFGLWLATILIFVVGATLQCILYYFPMKALGSILRILMEMEFNSRGVKINRVS